MFSDPGQTSMDLEFSLFGFPVRIHPTFWVIAIVFGLSAGTPLFITVWVAVVLVSLLVHELGHAFTIRKFGEPSEIVLYWGGGLTISYADRRTSAQNILVSLAGPGAGFALAAILFGSVWSAGGVVSFDLLFGVIPSAEAVLPDAGAVVNFALNALLWVNIFWGLLNLIPVWPLDGGQAFMQLFLIADPENGSRDAFLLSIVSGVLAASAGLVFLESTYISFMFGYLAFQSFQYFRVT